MVVGLQPCPLTDQSRRCFPSRPGCVANETTLERLHKIPRDKMHTRLEPSRHTTSPYGTRLTEFSLTPQEPHHSPSLRNAPTAISRSVVVQKGGIDALKNSPYLAVTSRGSRTATTPRSSAQRMSRPAPWASKSAAWPAATVINPLPPAYSTALLRAAMSGSSGRGNGIRSITTRRQVSPGMSTPCHNDTVPNRQVRASAMNRRVRSARCPVP